MLSKYARIIYNPHLRKEFRYVYQAQVDEYHRLYGSAPSHINGHRHMHLCMNMLLDGIIPQHERIRRNFFFWPGERSILNRTYRQLVDRMLARRYRMTNYFFALSQCLEGDRLMRVADLAREATVELMTHPAKEDEYAYLMGEEYPKILQGLIVSNFSSL